MASIPASTAQSDTNTALAALQAADNATFISASDAAILDATSQGLTQISANTFGSVDAETVVSYYVNLGYKVSLPDFQNNVQQQPAQQFGEFWVEFWNGTLPQFTGVDIKKNPVRILISWA